MSTFCIDRHILHLKEISPPEKPNQEQGERGCDHQYNVKSPPGFFKRNLDVHSKETSDKSRYHEDNSDDSKSLDKRIEVIGNNRAVCIHRPTQDIGIDIGHAQCLPVINDDILKEISLFFILPKT
jgi:hypothetical protein